VSWVDSQLGIISNIDWKFEIPIKGITNTLLVESYVSHIY